MFSSTAIYYDINHNIIVKMLDRERGTDIEREVSEWEQCGEQGLQICI